MKPIPSERTYLNLYFNKVLGYGNKCVKCKFQGVVSNFTDSLVEFYCPSCFKKWAFLPDDTIQEMLRKGKDARKPINKANYQKKINKESN